MSKFYVLEPEVPGGLGERTSLDSTQHPPVVHRLHFVFDGWLGDHLIESFPCYLVSETLADRLRENQLTGASLEAAEIGASEQFKDLHPDRALPKFLWLKVNGVAGTDDFGITSDNLLAVSKRVLDVILRTEPKGLTYQEHDSA